MADLFVPDGLFESDQIRKKDESVEQNETRNISWRVDIADKKDADLALPPDMERELRLRNLKQAVQGIDPQKVNSAFEVARKTGINPAVAMADPERFRRELEATPDWEKLKNAPATQAHLSNPVMMAASQNDINALTDVERLQVALAYGGARRVMREKVGRQAVDDWYGGYTPDVELGFWNNIGGSLIEGLKASARGINHFFAAGSEQMMGKVQTAFTDLGYTPEQATAYLENGIPLPLLADDAYKGDLPWYMDPGNDGRPEYDNYQKRTIREKVAVLNDSGLPRYFYNFMKWVSKKSREELDPDSLIGGMIEADAEFLTKVAKKGGGYQLASDIMFGVASMANMMLFSLLGHPEIGFGLMYSQIAGGDIEKGEMTGIDPAVNWRAANWNAFLQTPLEALSIGKAVAVWKPQKMLGQRFKRFVESVVTEGVTEGIQAVPEELAEAYRMSNAEDIFEVKNFFQNVFTAEFLRKAGYQSAVGALSAGLIGGPGMSYHAVFSRGDENSLDPIKALKDGIDGLRTSKRSVAVLENFTGEMVKGGHLPETVFLPARQVASLFQDEPLPEKLGATLELMDVDRAEFEAALESDGEVQVNGAKLGPLMASPYREQFSEMVHLNPVERESVGVVKGMAEKMEEGADFVEAAVSAAEMVAAEKLASEPIADASPYRERIKKDLMEKAKLSPSKAEAYTAIIDANAHIWASLPGESIDSYYERYGYRMERTDFGEVLAQAYETHGAALGVKSEVEFFNRYKTDDTFREQINSLLQFGTVETEHAENPFVLDVDNLIEADLSGILDNAAKVEELIAGGHDSVQINVGGQSYVYPLSISHEGDEAPASQAVPEQKDAHQVLFMPVNPEVNLDAVVSFVDLSKDYPLKVNKEGVKEFTALWKGVSLEIDTKTQKGRWKARPASGNKKRERHPVWSSEESGRKNISRRKALAALEKILNGAALIETLPPKHKGTTKTFRFYVPVVDRGKPSLLRIVAHEMEGQKAEMDGVEIYDIIKEKPTPGTTAKASGKAGPAGLSELKIRQMLAGVKDAKGKFYVPGPNTVFHGHSQPRGAHAITAEGQSIIHFFEASNDSTPGHEIFHAFRRVLEDMALHPKAPTWVRQDWATACDFVGTNVGEVWTKEQEETWAKAGEAYLWEGKTPSPALRGAFSTLRRWLLNVYRTVLQIGVKINPEIREVMDRMLATEAEIGEARAKMDTAPLFEGEEIGELAQEYAEWAKKAALASDPEIQRKTEAEQKKLTPKWKKQAKQLADEHEGHRTLDAIVESGGIGLKALEDMNLADEVLRTLKSLRKKKVVRAGGGDPDQIAEQHGFDSPEELISYILTVPSKAEIIEASLQEQEVQWREAFDPETVIMTEQYERLMEREAEILAKATKGQVVKGAAIKKIVRQRTGQVRVGRIQMTEMAALKSVIRREAAAARKAYSEGKKEGLSIAGERSDQTIANIRSKNKAKALETALAAKERQRRAIAELRAKHKAKAEIKQIVNYLKRQGKAAQKGKAMTADANEQVRNILEGFDLRVSVSLKELDRRKALEDWAKAQEEQGKVVDLPPNVLRDIGRTHYKQMTLDDLRDLKNLVKNIETVGRNDKKMLVKEKKVERAEVVGSLVRSAEKNYDGTVQPAKIDYDETIRKKIGTKLGSLNAGLTKVLTMCDRLDGGETGWWTDTIYRPVSEALDRAAVRKGKSNMELGKMMEAHYSKAELSKWRREKIHVNESVGFLTKEQLIAVGFNAGNAYNLNAVKEGAGWSDQDMKAILDRLTDRDWDFIQGVWEYLDREFWPGISDLYRDLTGNAPKKVKPEPFVTPTGKKVRGGYYPLKAKADASVRASQINEAETVQQMMGSYLSAQTRNGHIKARSDFGGQPVDLSIKVLFGHVSNVITDLEMRRSVIDVNYLLNNKHVSDIAARTLGIEAHKQMKKWLAACAGSGNQTEATGLDKWAAFARKNKTVASMGFKATTFLSQFAGLFNSTGLVGVKAMAGGLSHVMANPKAAYKFIEESSVYMSDRRNNFDRELADRAKHLGRKGTFDKITEYSFYHIREADFLVSSITWFAAYDKALNGGVDHVDAVFEADKAVQMSQGGGRVADLAAVQRGGEWRKLFTMFYTFFSQQYQQFSKMYYDVRRTKNFGQFAARCFWLWFAPAVVSELLAGRWPDEDEDWASWAVKETVLYPFLTVPGLREVSQGMFSDFGAQKTVFGELGESFKYLYKEATDDDDDNVALFQKTLRFSGYLAPLPTAQADITIGQFAEYLAGEKRHYSPRDIFLRDRE